jgi:hypothetical protein
MNQVTRSNTTATPETLPAPLPPSSYWVVPRLLLAGGYPVGMDLQKSAHHLDFLLKAGIRTFINLVEEGECQRAEEPIPSYHSLLSEAAHRHEVSVTYVRIPVPDRSAPSSAVMRQILDSIDRAMELKEPVYVHCWAGIGRTGTVVGCYLMRHGQATVGNVVAKIRTLRAQTGFPGPSPHTAAQVKLVIHWKRDS